MYRRNTGLPPLLKQTGRLTLKKQKGKNYNQIQSARAPQIPNYEFVKTIGRGAFGIVVAAKDSNGCVVAIKKVKLDPHFVNRELEILKELDSKYCIRLINYFNTRECNEKYLNVVMEYFPQDLFSFVLKFREKKKFVPLIYVKLYGYQLFCGLNYLHTNGIAHRDLKPQNILINEETVELKICDFGSAKKLHDDEKSVAYIASRYYRAPELFMNCSFYTNAIDIWAAGCVIAEMLRSGLPLFQGISNMRCLEKIVNIIGQPTEDDYLSFQHTVRADKEWKRTTNLADVLPTHTPFFLIDLLEKIFVYNPKKRITAYECMNHPFFNDLFTGNSIVLPNGNTIPSLSRNQ